MKLKAALLYLGLPTLLALGFWQNRVAGRWESRAEAAERFAAAQADSVRALEVQRERLRREAEQRDTVIQVREKLVRVVDSLYPPPDTCRPNLAARDTLIAEQHRQIETLRAGWHNEVHIAASLQASVDSLRGALAARPKSLLRLPFLEIGRPEPTVFAGVCAGGGLCAGAGVSISIRLGVH